MGLDPDETVRPPHAPRVRIVEQNRYGSLAELHLDGQRFPAPVTAISVDWHSKDLRRVTVQFLAESVEVVNVRAPDHEPPATRPMDVEEG